MLASCCLKTLNEIAGTPSTREIESGSRSRSTSVPRSARRSDQRRCGVATTTSANAFGVAHLALDAQDRVLLRAGQQAHRQVGVGALQRRRDLGRRELVGAQPLRVEVDAHLAHRQPADVDAGHAVDALEPLADHLVGEQRQLARAARPAPSSDR